MYCKQFLLISWRVNPVVIESANALVGTMQGKAESARGVQSEETNSVKERNKDR